MENKTYVKLKDLVGSTFTVNQVPGYKFKMWDSAEKRMIVRDTYDKDFRKLYQVETDKGSLDMGSGQIGNLLEAVLKDGVADINNKTFEVKSNGKEGMDIRYFFNLVTPKKDVVVTDVPDEPINLDDLPF